MFEVQTGFFPNSIETCGDDVMWKVPSSLWCVPLLMGCFCWMDHFKLLSYGCGVYRHPGVCTMFFFLTGPETRNCAADPVYF